MRTPWTKNELDNMLPKLDLSLKITEAQIEGIKPVPPMTLDESRDYFFRFFDLAQERPLTKLEAVTMGQLLAVYEQAIRAEMLGLKGRYLVVGEDQLPKIMEMTRKVNEGRI